MLYVYEGVVEIAPTLAPGLPDDGPIWFRAMLYDADLQTGATSSKGSVLLSANRVPEEDRALLTPGRCFLWLIDDTIPSEAMEVVLCSSIHESPCRCGYLHHLNPGGWATAI